MTGPAWTESTVRAVVDEQFAEVLPDVGLGDTDNFFRRGGDSIGMLRMVNSLRSRGLPLTVRDFVIRPTPAGVVQSVMAQLARHDHQGSPPASSD